MKKFENIFFKNQIASYQTYTSCKYNYNKGYIICLWRGISLCDFECVPNQVAHYIDLCSFKRVGVMLLQRTESFN